MRIAIVGTGNLGYALIHSFSKHEDFELYVYGRNKRSIQQFVKTFNIIPIQRKDLEKAYDLIILAITDTAIEEFSHTIDLHPDSIIAHTSGATSIDVLSKHSKYAIFYPLYSFPKKRKVNFIQVPMLLDYSSPLLKNKIDSIALRLSNKLYEANDRMRLQYHLSAVFANNFANHLLTKAYGFLSDKNLDKEVLLPIIKQSCRNWSKGLAETTQTGPARRNDTRTLNMHRELLENESLDMEIYNLLTKSIKEYYTK